MARQTCGALSIAGYTVANVPIDSASYIIARLFRNVIDRVVEHVIRRVVHHVVRGVAGRVVGSVISHLFLRGGARWLQDGLSYRPVLWRVAHQAQKRGAIPEALGHAGREEPPTWVAELVEDHHKSFFNRSFSFLQDKG